MMCERPYIKMPSGVSRLQTIVNEDARKAVTPFGCGHCLPCRINKSREWTHRILLEQRCHGDSCFMTLTYNDDAIPRDWSLEKSDVQKWLKRLRKKLGGTNLRYFAVGEYGKRTDRPHYHVIIFGLAVSDHAIIESTWKNGFVHIGELNAKSARYCVGYVIKDWMKPDVVGLDGRRPEFMLASRKEGGIGYPAIKRIAEKMLESEHFKPFIVRELNHGKKRLPLGRYLTAKLNNLIGIPEETIDDELRAYQESVIFEHLAEGQFYYDSIVDSKQADRNSQKAKHKIFNRKDKF